MSDLKGKVAVVTGATSGIGLETAAALAGRGATVILGCRNTSAAQDVVKQITGRHPGAKVSVGPPLDLLNQDSVRAFAADLNARKEPLHILVNNAGVSFMKKDFTLDGVGAIAQTNHLGPYTLTRLLEKKLVDGKARVVTVASVTHRMTTIKDAKAFLTEWRSGYYEHTKLANVLFAYELQRRLGGRGVQSCAADPGGVRSSIWDKSPKFSKGFLRSLVDACYSPPEDGCQAIVHAATVPWDKERKSGKSSGGGAANEPLLPHADLRYYARGLFTSGTICNVDGVPGKTFLGKVSSGFWGLGAVFASMCDYPLRKLSGGRLAGQTKLVRSSRASYDEKVAADLWDVSAEIAKLPKSPAV